MPKLTKRLVETLPVRTGDYIVFDSEVNGFGVRVMPSGKRSYIVKYRNGGRISNRRTNLVAALRAIPDLSDSFLVSDHACYERREH